MRRKRKTYRQICQLVGIPHSTIGRILTRANTQ
ncbi:hypothetical protein [Thiohalobacter sp. IOR34]